MISTAAIADTAALVGEPARAAVLLILMDGRALTVAADVTPQTASGHLGRLIDAGLLAMVRQCRHRYHRLASPAVARMVEASCRSPAPSRASRPPRVGPADVALRAARTCYDHLTDALVMRSHVEWGADGGAVTVEGERFLAGLGIAARQDGARHSRPFCCPCLDWSERRPHLAGTLSANLCARCLELGWVRRLAGTRALEITRKGYQRFGETFGVVLD